MNYTHPALLRSLPCLLAATAACCVALRAAVPPSPPGGTGGTLLRFDFEGARTAWPALAAAVKPVGTIDAPGGAEASRGLLLAGGGAHASGLLPVRNAESDPGKLTLAFSLSAASVAPVTVRVESFDAAKRRTGGREALVYPAAPGFYQRFAVDLSATKPAGGGAFRPTDPFVQFTFAAAGGGELRVDNVHYAAPAYYVSPKGNDANDGRAEKTAFATPQRAIDAAGPGDVVLLMEGTYLPRDAQEGVAAFRRPGAPDAWITLKNYPGHRPVLSTAGAWNAIRIGQRGTKDAPAPGSGLGYIELRGLHVRGEADVAKEKYAKLIGESDPKTNGNGITISSRFEKETVHHVRIADSRIELCPGGGVAALEADWVAVENNTVRDNCWWMIYAGSGISLLGTANFDGADNVYKALVRNNVVSGNRCFVSWRQIGKVSDGNGIIIDSTHVPAKNASYRGRTLIQNNLTFNNGGSGIHAFKARRVDIVNNTAYLNGASPELRWGQIFLQRTDDARVVNNILWARDGQPVNTVGPNLSDRDNTNVVRSHNLYFGGGTKPIPGENDVVADPRFVKPSVDPAVADFRVRPGSPAVGTGARLPIVPYLDLDGRPRGGGAPDRGAYERPR